MLPQRFPPVGAPYIVASTPAAAPSPGCYVCTLPSHRHHLHLTLSPLGSSHLTLHRVLAAFVIRHCLTTFPAHRRALYRRFNTYRSPIARLLRPHFSIASPLRALGDSHAWLVPPHAQHVPLGARHTCRVLLHAWHVPHRAMPSHITIDTSHLALGSSSNTLGMAVPLLAKAHPTSRLIQPTLR